MKKFNLNVAFGSLVIDLVAIFAGLVIAYHLRSDSGNLIYNWPFPVYLRFIGWMLPVWLLLLASQGLYNVRSLPRGWNAFGRLLIGLLSGWGVMIIALYLWRSPEAQAFPRLVIAYGLFWTFLLTLAGRFLLNQLLLAAYRRRIGLVRTVVVAGSNSSHLINALNRDLNNGRLVVATLESGYLGQIQKLFQAEPFDELLIADTHLAEEEMLQLLSWSESHFVNFTLVPSLLSVRSTNVETGSVAGTPVLFFRRTKLEGWGRVLKRVLDVIFVSPALIVLSPIFLVLATLVKLTSPGPVFYKERRIGQDGRLFTVTKFRSMFSDWRVRFPDIKDWSGNEAADVRITSLGRFLRKTNLDEIPQLWDVLMGRMTLVGPRPEQPKYVEQFSQEIPDYLKRHHVKTGLTGWAQINGLRGDTSIAERVKYDLYYIENWTIWFDIRIIIATAMQLIRSSR